MLLNPRALVAFLYQKSALFIKIDSDNTMTPSVILRGLK
jgi:hypothetical protein